MDDEKQHTCRLAGGGVDERVEHVAERPPGIQSPNVLEQPIRAGQLSLTFADVCARDRCREVFLDEVARPLEGSRLSRVLSAADGLEQLGLGRIGRLSDGFAEPGLERARGAVLLIAPRAGQLIDGAAQLSFDALLQSRAQLFQGFAYALVEHSRIRFIVGRVASDSPLTHLSVRPS